MMALAPHMTYLQSLKVVARGLVQWPITLVEIRCIAVDATIIAKRLATSAFRLICLLTLPISAPLLTLLVQRIRKDQAAAVARAKADMFRRFNGQIRNNHDTTD
jgi:hypothetical protein